MVTLYTKPNCAQCNAVKAKLVNAGIEYDDIDLPSHPDDLNYLKDNGFTSAPVIEDSFGGLWTHREVKKVIDIEDGE